MTKRHGKSRRRRSGGLRKAVTWLGWGALGLTAFWLGSGQRRSKAKRAHSASGGNRPARIAGRPGVRPNEEPRFEEGQPEAASPAVALPPAARGGWIVGPAGSLRIAELHPEARHDLVLIHGLGGRLEHWAPLLGDLGPGLRAVAVDLPGHGRSDQAYDGDYSVPALASAIGAVLDGLGLRRAVLVAHSLGAAAAIEYAGRAPGRVAGLLLVDPSGDQSRLDEAAREAFLGPLRRDPEGEFRWYFRQLLGEGSPGTAEEVLESLTTTSPEVLLAALEGAAAYSPREALGRYSGPVSMVVGELNAGPASLPSLYPELPVRKVPFAGHWLMLDRLREVREALWELLDAVHSS